MACAALAPDGQAEAGLEAKGKPEHLDTQAHFLLWGLEGEQGSTWAPSGRERGKPSLGSLPGGGPLPPQTSDLGIGDPAQSGYSLSSPCRFLPRRLMSPSPVTVFVRLHLLFPCFKLKCQS